MTYYTIRYCREQLFGSGDEVDGGEITPMGEKVILFQDGSGWVFDGGGCELTPSGLLQLPGDFNDQLKRLIVDVGDFRIVGAKVDESVRGDEWGQIVDEVAQVLAGAINGTAFVAESGVGSEMRGDDLLLSGNGDGDAGEEAEDVIDGIDGL